MQLPLKPDPNEVEPTRVEPMAVGQRRPPSTPPPAVGFPSGTVIGRYVVVRPLGYGGMGAVMLAFDTQLGRSVALKLMRTHVESDEARLRFVREAQAMARLSHPNVVGIYDVGVHEGNVFLAMEYVDGDLLSAWLKEKHSVREVVAVMKQAAEGLRAAHDAGIVHRDFKPTNVLIAKGGRVCVFDFGIARTEGIDEPTVARASASSGQRLAALVPRSSDSPSRLTEPGSMIGTVGYASPEQTLGEETDARSDVFSFTVTLWLALYGEKPFDSSSVVDYVLAVNAPARPARPAGTHVPAWLHRVLERGLAREPSARFRSMGELLSAMDADPTRRRRRLAVAAVVVVGAALVALGFTRHEARLHAVCRAEGDAVANAWSAKRAAVEKGLRSETDSFAGERTDRTLATLDAYAAAWRSVQVESCEATRVAKTQPRDLYDRRSQCLLERQMQFDVVADVLAGDETKLHHESLAMATGLEAPAQCSDASMSKTLLPLPQDPAARAKSLEARRDLLRANYPGAMGFAGAQRLAEQARGLAHEATDARTEAVAELRIGTLAVKRRDNPSAFQTLLHAYASAEAVGADYVAADAALQLAFIFADRAHRDDDAHEWLEVADAKIARMGGSQPLEIERLEAESHIDVGDPRRALDLNARAAALIVSAYGETSMRLCHAYATRAYLYTLLGEPDNGADEAKLAIECQIRATASSSDDDLIISYLNLADAQLASGRWGDAVTSARSATTILSARDGDAGMLAVSFALEAMAIAHAGNAGEAANLAERAVAVSERHANQWMSQAEFALGLARSLAGDARGASEACGRAVAIDDKEDPPSADKLYEDDRLCCLGEAELALGEVRHARAHLERSAGLQKRAHPGALALARFALARALVARPAHARGANQTDETRARALGAQARDELLGVAQRYPFLKPSLDAVDAWLAEGRHVQAAGTRP